MITLNNPFHSLWSALQCGVQRGVLMPNSLESHIHTIFHARKFRFLWSFQKTYFELSHHNKDDGGGCLEKYEITFIVYRNYCTPGWVVLNTNPLIRNIHVQVRHNILPYAQLLKVNCTGPNQMKYGYCGNRPCLIQYLGTAGCPQIINILIIITNSKKLEVYKQFYSFWEEQCPPLPPSP